MCPGNTRRFDTLDSVTYSFRKNSSPLLAIKNAHAADWFHWFMDMSLESCVPFPFLPPTRNRWRMQVLSNGTYGEILCDLKCFRERPCLIPFASFIVCWIPPYCLPACAQKCQANCGAYTPKYTYAMACGLKVSYSDSFHGNLTCWQLSKSM